MDATKVAEELKLPYENMSLRKEKVVKIDVSQITGLKAQGNHALIPVPKGMVIDSIRVLIADSVTSGGAATVKFSIGSVDLMTAAAVTTLTKGTVLNLDPNAKKVVDFETDYSLAMTVSAADLTAGAFFIIYAGFPIQTVTERG